MKQDKSRLKPDHQASSVCESSGASLALARNQASQSCCSRSSPQKSIRVRRMPRPLSTGLIGKRWSSTGRWSETVKGEARQRKTLGASSGET